MEKWQDPQTIALWIVLAVGFLAALLLFIILLVRANFKRIIQSKEAENKAKLEYQQELLATAIKTQEKERKRIAADLHDELIGKLTVLSLLHEKEGLEDQKEMIENSISTVRRISHDLSPPLIEFSSLLELILDLFEPWKLKYKIDSYLDIRFEIEHSDEFKIQVIRVIQEILKNAQKHAEANHLFYQIRQTEKYTVIKISDDGKGFDVAKNSAGLGQKNIESRVEFFGGKHQIRSSSKGTTFILIFKNKSDGED